MYTVIDENLIPQSNEDNANNLKTTEVVSNKSTEENSMKRKILLNELCSIPKKKVKENLEFFAHDENVEQDSLNARQNDSINVDMDSSNCEQVFDNSQFGDEDHLKNVTNVVNPKLTEDKGFSSKLLSPTASTSQNYESIEFNQGFKNATDKEFTAKRNKSSCAQPLLESTKFKYSVRKIYK